MLFVVKRKNPGGGEVSPPGVRGGVGLSGLVRARERVSLTTNILTSNFVEGVE